ncbi:hypothetical protein CBL_01956 [Carabus blaptoides fortunei]
MYTILRRLWLGTFNRLSSFGQHFELSFRNADKEGPMMSCTHTHRFEVKLVRVKHCVTQFIRAVQEFVTAARGAIDRSDCHAGFVVNSSPANEKMIRLYAAAGEEKSERLIQLFLRPSSRHSDLVRSPQAGTPGSSTELFGQQWEQRNDEAIPHETRPFRGQKDAHAARNLNTISLAHGNSTDCCIEPVLPCADDGGCDRKTPVPAPSSRRRWRTSLTAPHTSPLIIGRAVLVRYDIGSDRVVDRAARIDRCAPMPADNDGKQVVVGSLSHRSQ